MGRFPRGTTVKRGTDTVAPATKPLPSLDTEG
jgi:hypothetical protein